jgi:hypothetical protein
VGRLRHDRDARLFHNIAEEVVDLFGVDDCTLYRWYSADNETNRDPLYDEPTCGTSKRFVKYLVKAMFFDLMDTPHASEFGLWHEDEAAGYISVMHCEGAGVPRDAKNEHVGEGDVLGLHTKSFGTIYFDIVQSVRTGFINDSGSWTGYDLKLRRTSVFDPTRNVDVP